MLPVQCQLMKKMGMLKHHGSSSDADRPSILPPGHRGSIRLPCGFPKERGQSTH
ncbi:MAG: hypothetical protein R3F54_07545 [Alphaproteobacteria bacterium]